MIRSLRRRFILGAMAAFLILLILLVGGIAAAGYYQMESSADALLESALDGARLVLMDNSERIRMLSGILLSALRIGLVSMAVLFLILLPVSDRVVRSYAANIERQKQFITNAGHEIKTPVAIILSNVDASSWRASMSIVWRCPGSRWN